MLASKLLNLPLDDCKWLAPDVHPSTQFPTASAARPPGGIVQETREATRPQPRRSQAPCRNAISQPPTRSTTASTLQPLQVIIRGAQEARRTRPTPPGLAGSSIHTLYSAKTSPTTPSLRALEPSMSKAMILGPDDSSFLSRTSDPLSSLRFEPLNNVLVTNKAAARIDRPDSKSLQKKEKRKNTALDST